MALDEDLLKELNGEDFEDDLASLLDQMVGTDSEGAKAIEEQLNSEDDLSGVDSLLGDYDDIFGMMNSLEEEPEASLEEDSKKEPKAGFLKKLKESRAQKKLLKEEKRKAKKEAKEQKKAEKKNAKKDSFSEELEADLTAELASMQPELASMGLESDDSINLDLFADEKKPDKKAEEEEPEENNKKTKNKKEKKEKKEKKKKELSPKEQQELQLKKEAKERRRAEDRADVVKIKILDILLGVTVVVALVCVIYFGSSAFSYQHKMKQATNYFVDKNYIEAYELIGGLDVKEKDEGFYKQLICVMQVERSTKEFQSFYQTGEYAEALNCLLVGVKNYEENLSEGKELGAEEALSTSYERVLTSLSDYYGIAEAKTIVNTRNRQEYQTLVQTKAKNVKIEE